MENWKEVKASERAIKLFLSKIMDKENTTTNDKWLAGQTLNYVNESVVLTKDQIQLIIDVLGIRDNHANKEEMAFALRLQKTLAQAKS